MLEELISCEQTGFLRDRSISKMFAQELSDFLDYGKERDNMTLKCDMERTYDRVEWNFICLMCKKLGVGENIINLASNLV